MQGLESFPLTWPPGWQRTPAHQRKKGRYTIGFAKARGDVVHNLRLMGVRNHDVVISSNIPSKSNGLPYATYAEPSDPGVAIYWTTRDNECRVIACDKWRTVRENLRAVGLALEALRTLERTGSSEILNRAFTGFAALPPSGEDWRAVLQLYSLKKITIEDVEGNYRALALKAHPDQGGSHDAMVRLNAARDAALKFMGIG